MPKFRKDDGEIIEVDFLYAIHHQTGSLLELPDGTTVRRVYEVDPPIGKPPDPASRPVVSDTLGFTEHQLPQMQEHLARSGIRGVEFTRDPMFDKFIQVRCDSERVKWQYANARGMYDQNSRNGSGAMLSEKMLEEAREMAGRGVAD
jgi:hypothetical protein